nr:hypothetical protein GCM10020093_012950 [Planobispora longispora]
MDEGEPDPETDGVPLANRRMWNGGDPVGRLRSLHVAFGFTLIALALSLPFASDPLFRALFLLGQMTLLLVVALVALPYAAVRRRPGGEPDWLPLLTGACTGLRLLALILYGLALTAGVITGGPDVPADRGRFPASTASWRRSSPRRPSCWWPSPRERPSSPGAAGNRSTPPCPTPGPAGPGRPVTLLMAWALAAVFAIGLAFAVAEIMGTPSFTGGGTRIVLSGPYWWSTLAMLLAALTVILLALWLLLSWRREVRRLMPELRQRYPKHTEHVCRSWAAATLTDKTDVVVTVIATIGAIAVALAAVLITIGLRDVPTGPAVALGVVVTAGVAVGLVYVGWQAYEHPALRSTVGVLWDVTTFWPRATHPRPALLRRARHPGPPGPGQDPRPRRAQHRGGLGSQPGQRHRDGADPPAGPRRPPPHAPAHPRLAAAPALRALLPHLLRSRHAPGRQGDRHHPGAVRRRGARLPLVQPPPALRPHRRPGLRAQRPLGARHGRRRRTLWDPADPSLGRTDSKTPPRIFGHSDYYLDPAYEAAFRRLIS